jgi:hypothetical protein
MWKCSKCGSDASDTLDACWTCGVQRRDGDATDLAPSADQPPKPPEPQVGVPRRFGMATMMIFTTMFVVLFAAMKTFHVDAHPAVFAAIPLFVAGVGFSQAVLFRGKDPRRASYFGGIISGIIIAAGVVLFLNVASGSFNDRDFCADFVAGLVLALLFGGPFGYLAGCVVAGIFLVRHEPDSIFPPPSPPSPPGSSEADAAG